MPKNDQEAIRFLRCFHFFEMRLVAKDSRRYEMLVLAVEAGKQKLERDMTVE